MTLTRAPRWQPGTARLPRPPQPPGRRAPPRAQALLRLRRGWLQRHHGGQIGSEKHAQDHRRRRRQGGHVRGRDLHMPCGQGCRDRRRTAEKDWHRDGTGLDGGEDRGEGGQDRRRCRNLLGVPVEPDRQDRDERASDGEVCGRRGSPRSSIAMKRLKALLTAGPLRGWGWED